MSNVQHAKHIYAAFGRGDIPTVLAAFDPAIEWRQAEGNPYEPAYKEVKHPRPVREIYQEVKYEPMIPETVVRHKYKEEPAQEVKLGRTIHAPHKHGAPIVEEEVVQERSAYADFDMHDAVIKSAILNRPEY